jgi:hypothetical protein
MALYQNWHMDPAQTRGMRVRLPPGLLVDGGAAGEAAVGSPGAATPAPAKGALAGAPQTSRDHLTGSWLVSSAEERRFHTARVGGSTPPPATGSLRGDPRRRPRRPEPVDLDNSIHWACSSSFGRAPALQAGGARFEPGQVHGACCAERETEVYVAPASTPTYLRSSGEEHQLPKLMAGGSNPLGGTRCRAGRYMLAVALIGSPRGPTAAAPPSGGPSTHAGVAHVGPEHLSCKQADAGSIPVTSSSVPLDIVHGVETSERRRAAGASAAGADPPGRRSPIAWTPRLAGVTANLPRFQRGATGSIPVRGSTRRARRRRMLDSVMAGHSAGSVG